MAGKINNRVAFADVAASMGIKPNRESMLSGSGAAKKPAASDVDASELAEVTAKIAEIERAIQDFADPHGKRVKIAERRAEMAKAMRDYLRQYEEESILLQVKTNQILETEQAEYARLGELRARLAELVKVRDYVQHVRTDVV
jgi:hypothetical protein